LRPSGLKVCSTCLSVWGPALALIAGGLPIFGFLMFRTRATSVLRRRLSSSIQLRLATSRLHSRLLLQKPNGWNPGDVDGQRTEELVQPDFQQTKWVAPKRTLFYVPGSSQKMIDKAWSLEVDNIVSLPELKSNWFCYLDPRSGGFGAPLGEGQGSRFAGRESAEGTEL